MMSQPSPWWMPDVHADRQPFLRARRRVLAALRHYLETRDFAEVETAILQVSPGNEAHLHAFSTELEAPGGSSSCTHRRNLPAKSCSRPASAASSSSPACSAIGNRAPCTTRNSPCWNGTGRENPARP